MTRSNITEAVAKEIIHLASQGVLTSTLADQFCMDRTTVQRILRGTTWKELERPSNLPRRAGFYGTRKAVRLNPRTSPKETERFVGDVILPYSGEDCLIWPYARRSDGYGVIKRNKKQMLVSRYICILVNGDPPTSLHQAAHVCGKGHLGCVTPSHLLWKTFQENSDDKRAHGTQIIGARNGRAKLTEDNVREIRTSATPPSVLAEKFGVSMSTIIDIIQLRKWRHVA